MLNNKALKTFLFKKKQDKDTPSHHRYMTLFWKFLVVQLDNKKKQDMNIRKDETKFILCGSDKIFFYIYIYS